VHPVLGQLRRRRDAGSAPGARSDGGRVALVVEGGGGRGAFSGGMLAALDALGLVPAVDAVFCASAGAFNTAWLLSGDMDTGRAVWGRQDLVRETINFRALLRGRPVVDSAHLVEQIYTHRVPMDFARVLANPVEFHPLATDADTGESVDLHPLIRDVAALKRALRATSNLPLLGGRPVAVGGRRFVDAGVSEPVPVHTALRWGATHVLVLRTRPTSIAPEPISAVQRRFMTLWLGRRAPGTVDAWLARFERETADEELLLQHGSDPGAQPPILQIRPPDSAADLITDDRRADQLARAVEIGFAEAARALAPAAGDEA
jgi:predicted patatin/cPLA2 family phospholipase